MNQSNPKAAYGPEVREKNLEMAERMGVERWDLEVAAIADLTSTLRQITFSCDAPERLAYSPGNDLTLTFAIRDGAVVRRRYSIRHVDQSARTVDLQFVLHGDGPAGRWAAAAEIGDRVEGVGPRGKVVVVPGKAWYLFIADDAFIPAASAMIESLPADVEAHVYFEVDGAKDEVPLVTAATLAGPRFCYRDGAAPGTSTALADALATFTPPHGPGMAYIGAEHKMTNALRELLISRDVAADDISAKPYWRLGRANGDHGEPPREE